MTSKPTEIIKDNLSILDVVSMYVDVKKAGKDWKGKSPFTNEKTPSFFVSPEKGFFYCFSSGKGGDIFDFIQEIEKVDFKEALKILADQAGVTLDRHKGSSIEGNLYSLMEDTTKWYEINLRKNKEAVSYLLNRGLTKETIVKFRLGYAKNQWQDLYDYLKHKKYSDTHMEQCGLIVPSKKGRYYDRFRSRIMFPITDSRSRVVGFSGRIWGSGDNDKQAKYVNSPEGVLFDKSSILYGYDKAKQTISKKDTCILVEGQFDVVLAHQAGTQHTVAVSGTGLTDKQIRLIKRFTDSITLCFDSDNAGIKASRRSAFKAYEQGMKVHVVALPPSQDPADVINNSDAQWKVYLNDATSYIEYRRTIFIEQYPDASFQKRNDFVKDELFPALYVMTSRIQQEKELQTIAGFLGVSEDAVRSDFTTYTPEQGIQENSLSQERTVSETQKKPQQSLDEQIIMLLTYLQEHRQKVWSEYGDDFKERYMKIYNQQYDASAHTLDPTKKAMYSFITENQFSQIDDQKILDHLNHLMNQAQLKVLNKESQRILSDIRQAESRGDMQTVTTLQQKHHKIRTTIDRIII